MDPIHITLSWMTCDLPGLEFVAGTGDRTVCGAFTGQRHVKAFPMFAHPADLAGGDTNHEGIGFDVLVDDGAGADKGEFADGDSADDGAVGTEGCAPLYQGIAIFALAFNERTRVVDIGEDHTRAAEDAIFQGDVVVDGDIVLDLAAVADTNLVADEDVLPKGDALTDSGATADVDPMPDAGTRANLGAVVDYGCGMDGDTHQYSSGRETVRPSRADR